MPFFSIIVPVYNAKKYLKKCINSIINNGFDDYELILIDDGSVDNSWELMNKYKKQKDNIKIFRKENTGVSDTRNFGILKAEGEYIYFVDADDWIENGALKQIFDLLCFKKYDLLLFDYKRVYNENQIYYVANIFDKNIEFNGEKIQELGYKCLISGKLNNIGNKVYKKEIIERYNIRFNTSLKRGEDWIFNLDFISKCKNAKYVNKQYYNYRLNLSSATNKFDVDNLEKIKMLHKQLYTYIDIFSLNKIEANYNLNALVVRRYLDLIKKCFYSYQNADKHETKLYISKILNDPICIKNFKTVNYNEFDIVNKILLFLVRIKNYNMIVIFNKLIYSKTVKHIKNLFKRIYKI